ncbi:general transcription factor 3C polypeptide 1 [Nematolebias whitei]|uniref:general transcription factor 3C polypeptide 1 n=1 Tax=Nematolebias whitei TaxID=451745 RepID=UPI001899ED84|nr:general transcription factor 3C polypeptide 1 [Nematolebias whitei]
MDSLSIVIDEVSLEGLDGITIPTLWIRLENRQPSFPLKLDDSTKAGLIWKYLVNNTDLRFYELPQEREDVELFDRFKATDPETGVETGEKISVECRDIYPIHSVPDNKDGIQGSCAAFKERKNVTKQIRSKSFTPLISLDEALKIYGRKLVIVASQALRFHTLIGPGGDPDLKLSSDSYCVLERVGRARWQGELQKNLHGNLFNADARKVHYFRKSLIKHDLITTQSYAERLKTGNTQYSILLLLKRFHVNRRTKYDFLMECVSNFLQQTPEQFATMDMLRVYLNLPDDGTFKRLFNYMRFGKLIEFCHYPLEDLDPSAKPCTNKNGSKVLVRCVKLLKPYAKKNGANAEEEEDEEEDDDDYIGVRRRHGPFMGRIMERDLLSQAYDIILSSGTKGCSQRDISLKMNIGQLESRMVWRKLLKDGLIKGFMEDVGRQRITKFISKKCVGVSDPFQLFAKERERTKLLCSSAATETPATSNFLSNTTCKTAAKRKKKAGRSGNKDAEEQQTCVGSTEDVGDEKSGANGGKARGKSGQRKTSEEKDHVAPEQTQPDTPSVQSTQAECETPACTGPTTSTTPDSGSVPAPDQTAVEEENQSNKTPDSSVPQSDAVNDAESNKIVVADHVFLSQRSHETYRLLKRRNLIIEAVTNFKVIEGLFPLQKLINAEEKQDGVSTRCCKKTILRLVHSLFREGVVKLYTTTVIQDGITKKVDVIAHPSIEPNDERISQLIEQIRFKISSSASAVRLQQSENKAGEKQKASENLTASKTQRNKSFRKLGGDAAKDFKPIAVRGQGKSMGFQPKMQRLHAIHTFLWYLVYEHPLRKDSTETNWGNETPAEPESSSSDGKLQNSDVQQDLEETGSPGVSNLEEVSDDEECMNDTAQPEDSNSNIKVYVDEDSWKRFVPPVRVRKDFSYGWAMVGDLLLCLPLSIFVQCVQINYMVDRLEEFISDPVKQHYLVRMLPAQTKRQLLYKRKYIHSFHENLQRLVYMGLLQFGPIEKFKDKDQVCVYLKRNATIVDTSSCEPHYCLVTEPPDKPFETRPYTFKTLEDVERYWFDLMCVCLNTPLGVVRSKRTATEDEPPPSIVHDRYVFAHLSHLLNGSFEVCDDGSTPGDGKGAAGLDSEFFAHLKRNWLWTNHLLVCKKKPSDEEATQTKMRLKSLLSRNVLRLTLQAGSSTLPRYLTNKQPLMTENVEVDIEPASRIQQIVGGKGQKRKRSKKEVVKAPRRKRKEPKVRSGAHDEADHKALKMMTKRRVHWSVQEDSVIMLCSVASHALNSKLKRAFVPYCIVRDLLHSEFEISVDKTSLAVGRRSRYILKNPQTHLNYRISLAEMYQDKTLMSQLEDNKPADPDNAEDCAKAFTEFVRILRQKFTSIMNTQDFIIPDSKQELFSRFKISAIDDGKPFKCKDVLNSKVEIYAIVLHNLIQSTLAMTNSQMKTSRSFQTFHTYSQYDQELLCQVFIQSRKRRLLNRRRVGQTLGPKKNRGLPILPMSFQLSQTYYRHFSWRFPHSLCTDSFCFLRSLITNGCGDEKPVTTFYYETENRSQNGEEVLERKTEPSLKEKRSRAKEDGSRAGTPQTGTPEAKIAKDQDGVQNPTQAEEMSDTNNEKTVTKSTTDEQEKLQCSLKSEPGDAPSSRALTDDQQQSSDSLAASLQTTEASEDPPDVSDMLRFSLNSLGGACLVSLSLMSLGLLSVFVSIPKQIVMVDSNLVDKDVVKSMASLEGDDDDDEDGGEECEGKKRLQVSSHQASHTNYLLMRGYCSPGIVKVGTLSTNDNIVVESCILRLKLRDTPAHHCFIDQLSPSLNLTKCGPSLLPSIFTSFVRSPNSTPPSVEECERLFVQERGYTAQDIEACAQLRRSLDEAGENGLDADDVRRAHVHLQVPQSGRTRSLQQYLKDLQEGLQVVRVGSVGVRWVLMQHADPWLLTVNCKQLPQCHLTSERRPFLKSRHNIPFMRKRCSRELRRETEEPPAKTPAVDTEKVSDSVNTDEPSTVTEIPDEEEQQQETADGGDKPQSLEKEEEVHTCSEEKMETEQRRETRRRTRSSLDDKRAEEADSLPSGSADEEENVSFISRPWRFIDGKLNRPVCKGILEAVLFHIMSQPGLTQQALLEHYKHVLQPVAVLDLVQALVEMGCVTKKTLDKARKPSLFARSARQTKSEATLEEPDTIFYEPTLSCCLRLCQVLPNERHWNDLAP